MSYVWECAHVCTTIARRVARRAAHHYVRHIAVGAAAASTIAATHAAASCGCVWGWHWHPDAPVVPPVTEQIPPIIPFPMGPGNLPLGYTPGNSVMHYTPAAYSSPVPLYEPGTLMLMTIALIFVAIVMLPRRRL